MSISASERRERFGLNLSEVAHALGVGYEHLWGAVHLGVLPGPDTVLLGRSYYSPRRLTELREHLSAKAVNEGGRS
jgi:hypothetical protein